MSDLEKEISQSLHESPTQSPVKVSGDDRLKLLELESANLYTDGMTEPELFMALYTVNQFRCDPPLDGGEVRALSIDQWESRSGQTARVLPGMLEAEQQTDTDTGFGKHFIREHGAYVRYNAETETWLYYIQGAWYPDDANVVVSGLMKEMFIDRQKKAEAALRALNRMWQEVSDKALEDVLFDNGNVRKTDRNGNDLDFTPQQLALIEAIVQAIKGKKEALSGQSAQRIKAALQMARTEPGIAIGAGSLDAHPLLFNIYNHVLNLETTEIRPHSFEDMFTMQSLVDFNPGAPCPRFVKALEKSLPDKDTREYLQDFFGLCLSGVMSPDLLLFLGEGANGKGLLIRVISGVLGSYATKCSMTSFITTKTPTPGGARSDLSGLRGKRLITAAEANRKVTLDMELLKDWTGGEDFNARDLYQKAKDSQFRPQGKLILSMNHPPRISDQTHATWRRLRYIRFDVTIPASERNDNLAQELLETEGGGILNWTLKGWMRVRERMLDNKPLLIAPQSVLAATNEFKEEENQAARFFQAEVVVTAQGRVKSVDLYRRYQAWCARNGEFAARDQQLTMDLRRYCKEQGLRVDFGGHNHHTGWHHGIELRASEPNVGELIPPIEEYDRDE